MVECTGLENRRPLTWTVGSNPTPSANRSLMLAPRSECACSRFAHLVASGCSLRIVAPDHVGFGLSDQADFEKREMHHAEILIKLARCLDLQRIGPEIPDWGGPTGVGAQLRDPERVIAVTAINTSVFRMPEDGLTYRNFPSGGSPGPMTPRVMPDSLRGRLAAAAPVASSSTVAAAQRACSEASGQVLR